MMSVDEIFQKLATHMIKGMMFHQELANYYDFLHLCGYKKCHEYHYLDESCGYRKLFHYYVNHYGKLIKKSEIDSSEIQEIPKSWYEHTREDVDSKLKRQAVQSGVQAWVKWETVTKELYQHCFKQLIDLDEIATAMFLKQYIEDVNKELKKAHQKHLDLKAIDYEICSIIGCQEEYKEKYKQKIKEYKFYD